MGCSSYSQSALELGKRYYSVTGKKMYTHTQKKLCRMNSLINFAYMVRGDQIMFHTRHNILTRCLSKNTGFPGKEALGFPGRDSISVCKDMW